MRHPFVTPTVAMIIALGVLPLAAQSVPSAAVVAPTPQLAYQGHLLEAGVAANGARVFVFSLRDATGLELWSSGNQTVPVSDGLYSVVLGATGMPAIPPTVLAQSGLKLHVVIGGVAMNPDVELIPAFQSRSAWELVGAFSGDVTGTQTQAIVSHLQGIPVDLTTVKPTTGQGLIFDGTKFVPSTVLGPMGATGPQGPKGDTGATGAQGPQGVQGGAGATGAAGVAGAVGADGKTLLNGAGAPTSSGAMGSAGDFYLDTTNNLLFGPKAGARWVGLKGLSLVGPQGPTGPTGPTGATGAQGPQGVPGFTGATGATGAQGSPGASPFTLSGSDAVYTAGRVGIGMAPTSASALLELGSTTQGLLAPRMTAAQRTAIGAPGTPATGLLVFQTDDTAGFYYYNGSAWAGPLGTSSATGTVTSVAALTLGTSGTDLSSTVATATSTPVITLNVPTASALNRGALSATDWSTFNGKESTLTFSSPLSRSTNTISLGTVGVANGGTGATTASGARTALSVAASGANGDITSLTGLTTALTVAQGGTGATVASSARTNLGLGSLATKGQASLTTDVSGILPVASGGTGANTLTGHLIGNGTSPITASSTIPAADLSGTLSLLHGGTGATTASDARTSLGLGTLSTQDATAIAVTGGSLNGTTVGSSTPAAGSFTTVKAGYSGYFLGTQQVLWSGANTAADANNLVVGDGGSWLINNGKSNTLVGISAGTAVGAGANNTLIGTQAGKSLTIGNNNTLVGTQAGDMLTNNSSNTFLGYAAGSGHTSSSKNTFVGAFAGPYGTNGGLGNTMVGYYAGQTGLNSTPGSRNTFVGAQPYAMNNFGSDNIYIGYQASPSLSAPSSEIVIGNGAVGHGNSTLTIGAGDGTGVGLLSMVFISGIHGVTPSGSTQTVVIDSNGQLGSVTGAAGSGTVTSVAALTLNSTSATDLSSTVATGTSTPVITLNVPTASAANRGALSATDWSTFNAKAPLVSPAFTGTPTAPTASGGTNSTQVATTAYADSAAATAASYRAAKGANSDITSLSGLTTALSAGQGGTGLSTYAKGDVLYHDGTQFQKLTAGSTSSMLIMGPGGVPVWSVTGAGAITGNIWTMLQDSAVLSAGTETTWITSSMGQGSLTIPAGAWTAGKTLRVRLGGTATAGGNPTCNLYLRMTGGGTTVKIADTTTVSTSTGGWTAEFTVTCRSTSAASNFASISNMLQTQSSSLGGKTSTLTATVSNLNANNQTLDISGLCASTSLTATICTVEILN